jgi:hypothetical protein
MSGGKWKDMMIQKRIVYTSWNDNFRSQVLPEVRRISEPDKAVGRYVFTPNERYVSIEAEHFYDLKNASTATWTIIPFLGRTLSGVSVMPYSQPVDGSAISYKMQLPADVRSADVHVVVKSTQAFQNLSGHKYKVGFTNGSETVVNFNSDLNEDPKNIYSVFYPTVARRVIEKTIKLDIPPTTDSVQTLTIKPLDPSVVFEKIVVDYGGYKNSYLFMDESSSRRNVE